MSRLNGVMTHDRPEIELLLCCARTSLDAARTQRIRDLVQAPIDWEYLVRTSFAHGVMPLLYKNLSAICPEAAPELVAQQLSSWFRSHVQRNLLITAEMLRLLRLLAERGIAALPYKGPVLAASVYGDLSLRSFCDLDILVAKRDVLAGRDLLRAAGYCERTPLTNGQQAARLRSINEKDFAFIGPEGLVKVELHWELASRALFPFDTDKLWGRLANLSVAGASVFNLCPEDLLLILCVHGAKHSFRRLEWICDVSELIRSNPGIRWDDVVGQATRLRTKRMLYFGLDLASELLGAELPDHIQTAVKADIAARSLSRRAQKLLFSEIDSTSEALRRHVHRIGLRERMGSIETSIVLHRRLCSSDAEAKR